MQPSGGVTEFPMKLLSDRFALITGASQGLGRELALAYARADVRCVALDARGKKSLQKLKPDNKKTPPAATVAIIQADLGSVTDIDRVAAITLEACGGRLDVLVNNAPTLGPVPLPYLLDYPVDDFQQVLNVNLVAPFLLIQNLLAAMIDHGGSIINVTSDAGRVGYPGWGAYGISKFGLEGLSQTWAAELAESAVPWNLVDPGNPNTEMHRAAEPEEDPTEWADPAEATEVFIYLASEESKNINGQRFEAQEENRGRKAEATHSE